MGIFVRKLSSFGFSTIQIVSIRVTLAALISALVLLVKERKDFKISVKDIPLFLGLGFGSILFFTVCYFTAITMMPLSTATILLYTSPVWIMLMSLLFFHEKLDRKKQIALAVGDAVKHGAADVLPDGDNLRARKAGRVPAVSPGSCSNLMS